MNIKELRASTGMTQSEFGKYFNIPMRTIQNWEGGKRNCPKYLVELIEYKLEKEILTMKEVTNLSGTRIDFETSVQFMDDEIREELHNELAPCSDQEFFTAYEKAHEEKFGEEWELSKINPVY